MELNELLHFRINGWQVDVARCRLSDGQRGVQVEPKVMDVLHYLAKHPGEVVSQEKIFSEVWPNSIYSPGSLQRCILLLRKALGEDAQSAKIIITHAKRGYSLEASVKRISSTNSNKVIYGVLLAIVIMTISIFLLQKILAPQIKTEFKQLLPITATQEYEFYPVFSPASKEVVFIRAQSPNKHHIWVKDLETGIERQISSHIDNYHTLAWHPDGLGVLYGIGQEQSDLLGFIHLTNNHSSRLVTNYISGFISNLQWKTPESFYYLCDLPLGVNQGCKGLYQYDWIAQQSKVVFKADSGSSIEQMAVSPSEDRIAMSIRTNNHIQIQVLDLKSQQQKIVQKYDDGNLEVSWHPEGKHLLINHNNQLKLVSLAGKTQQIEFNNYLNVFYPSFNSQGTALTLTLAMVDQDIVELSLSNKQQNSVINSSSKDIYARYSPDNKAVVYVSYRAGFAQVFIKNLSGEQLVFENVQRKEIFAAPVWSNDGKFIAFAINKKVVITDVLGKIDKQFEVAENVYAVLDWYHHGDALLLGFNNKQQLSLAKFELSTQSQQTLQSSTGWASLDNKDNLLMLKDNRLLRVNNNKKEVLLSLDEDILRFIPFKERIYYQIKGRESSQIWKYSRGESELVYTLTDELHRLQDISEKSILVTTKESYNSDIVIFK